MAPEAWYEWSMLLKEVSEWIVSRAINSLSLCKWVLQSHSLWWYHKWYKSLLILLPFLRNRQVGFLPPLLVSSSAFKEGSSGEGVADLLHLKLILPIMVATLKVVTCARSSIVDPLTLCRLLTKSDQAICGKGQFHWISWESQIVNNSCDHPRSNAIHEAVPKARNLSHVGPTSNAWEPQLTLNLNLDSKKPGNMSRFLGCSSSGSSSAYAMATPLQTLVLKILSKYQNSYILKQKPLYKGRKLKCWAKSRALLKCYR